MLKCEKYQNHGQVRFHIPINQPATKGFKAPAGVPGSARHLGCQDPSWRLSSGGKEEGSSNTRGPLACLLVKPCHVIYFNGKLEQWNPGRTGNGPDSSGTKVWVSPPSEEPAPAEVLTEGKGNG